MNVAAKEWLPETGYTVANAVVPNQVNKIASSLESLALEKRVGESNKANGKKGAQNKGKHAIKSKTMNKKSHDARRSVKGKENHSKQRSQDAKVKHTKKNSEKPKNKKSKNGHKSKHKKNTESFEPDYSAPDCRIVVGLPTAKFGRQYSVHDIVMVPQLVCDQDDLSLYQQLVAEIQAIGRDNLLVEWHGDTHLIANDKIMGGKWKDKMPAFKHIVDRMRQYFDMDIKATRFNWYRDSKDWKPYHHDAAAVKAHFAQTQNCTVAVSVGQERECAFQHATTGTVVSCPQPNGCAYAFGRDVNLEWRHGVLPTKKRDCTGRISIIAWGYIEQTDEGTRQENHPFLKPKRLHSDGQKSKGNKRENNTGKKDARFKSRGGKGWFSK